MKYALVVALVWACSAACPAVAGDADCVRARDEHADFKAVLDDAPGGKPQYETIKRGGSDGVVTITRWVDGQKRTMRKSLHGVFIKVLQTFLGARTAEVAFSHSIDLTKAFPLRQNTLLDYRVAMGNADHFDPKFADVKVTVGAASEVAVGGCKLQALDLVIDTHSLDKGGAVSKSTIKYVPALDYSVAFRSQTRFHEKDFDTTTKVRAIEAWTDK